MRDAVKVARRYGFFSSRRRHTRYWRDWSSDVCSSDLQACHVFWQIAPAATLGTGTRFAGTVMALASIAAKTGDAIDGRLIASAGAVTLDTNTITASNCAGGSETQTPAERSAGILPPTAGSPTTKPLPSSSPLTPAQRAAKRKAVERRAAVRKRALAHRALPHKHGTFTG